MPISCLDSGWSNHSHRGWTTLISFAVQAGAVGCLLLAAFVLHRGIAETGDARATARAGPTGGCATTAARPNPRAAQSNLMGTG